MFKKILIANRGEIACRVAATARRMGVRTVAVYSDADAHAPHVAACDEAVHIGASEPRDSYLRGDVIIDAARALGAEAVHPGYGFLSENEGFARACAAAGLVFIGPTPEAIQAMGLKAASKQLMASAGVPLVPGYHGADQSLALLQNEADNIGYPVLIKASAGGGGKGMRVVERADAFAQALASCQREARNSFGNEAVLIEKYLQRPRHIEMQVFGDTHGNYVHLFERDCSVQRRHQKVLEEAPAPGMTPALRRQMGAAAIAAARAVGYVGAGTVEFIVEGDADAGPAQTAVSKFYFMEMNTRLQVEHPVTEAITGLDLVEWQLRVAAGQPLPLTQERISFDGHAIEARICAENPDREFLPATGKLQVFCLPACASFTRADLRVDSGVREGDTISPYYDAMVAKLIVYGETRDLALARLDDALAQTHIVGLANNVQFLRHVVQSQSFRQARLDTALIAREAQALFNQQRLPVAWAVAAVVGQMLMAERATEDADPFSRTDGWRSHGWAQRRFQFEVEGALISARLSYRPAGALRLTVAHQEGRAQDVIDGALHVTPLGGPARMDLHFANQRGEATVYRWGDVAQVHALQGAMQLRVVDLLAHAGTGAEERGRLTAPMPGKVVSFAVRAGEHVKKGQTLAVMEAMKMEHTLTAPNDGRVGELLYAPGDQIAEGAELLTLNATSEASDSTPAMGLAPESN